MWKMKMRKWSDRKLELRLRRMGNLGGTRFMTDLRQSVFFRKRLIKLLEVRWCEEGQVDVVVVAIIIFLFYKYSVQPFSSRCEGGEWKKEMLSRSPNKGQRLRRLLNGKRRHRLFHPSCQLRNESKSQPPRWSARSGGPVPRVEMGDAKWF